MSGQDAPIAHDSVRVVYFEPLSYPIRARWKHEQGTVVLRLRLDAAGRVTSSTLISGFESAIPDCLANSKKWHFEPNDEKAVIVVYRFSMEGLCHAPCTSQFLFHPPNLSTITAGNMVIEP